MGTSALVKARVRAVELRQIHTEARVEEVYEDGRQRLGRVTDDLTIRIDSLVEDMTSSFKQVSLYFIENEKRFDRIEATQDRHTMLLNQHSRKLDEHTAILEQHSRKLDEHTAILNQHSRKLDEHTAILGRHTAILEQHSRKLDEHTAILNQHSRKLDEHTAILNQHTVILEQHDKRLEHIEAALVQHTALLTQILEYVRKEER